MIQLQGKYNTAVCYTPELEQAAAEQIQSVCDQPAFRGCRIRIMPDVHAGTGCTIGTTMTIQNKIVPGMVGVDIGCGMETMKISEKSLDFQRLDDLIRREIPSGMEIREEPHELNRQIDLTEMRCARFVNLDRAARSVGTLGGGNHFIEVDEGENGEHYVVIHSGSRNLGVQVAKFYQSEAWKALWGGAQHQGARVIAELKEQERFREIQPTIEELCREHEVAVPKELAYVEGELFDDDIHDMRIVQRFAVLNRKAMMDVIVSGMGLNPLEEFTTIHNYIDTEAMILRKGSVSARKGEKLLIPINMRDGSLICLGKGNPDWNFSAPHGAGRLLPRKQAAKTISLEDYRKTMEGIWSSCVVEGTLDESPMAYKPLEEIVSQVAPTVDILERIRPRYNFKATD